MDVIGTENRQVRRYSDADKAKALIALDLNNGNVKFTADQLNIPRITLHTWKEGLHTNDDVLSLRHNKIKDLADKFEDLAHLYIAQAVDTVDKANGTNAITGAGIAVDKMRLLRGESTANIAVSHIAQNFQLTLEQALDLHKANPTKYPLPTRQQALDSYENSCRSNNVTPDFDAIDLSVLDGENID